MSRRVRETKGIILALLRSQPNGGEPQKKEQLLLKLMSFTVIKLTDHYAQTLIVVLFFMFKQQQIQTLSFDPP